MARIIVLALLLLPVLVTAQSIYRTTDKDGNVIFTDAPAADVNTANRVEVNPTNTAAPPPDIPEYNQESNEKPEPKEAKYEVVVAKPANETTIPMGPGNFSVTASIHPALEKYDSLQLYMDGEPWGEPQGSLIWDLTNVFRGAHDITIAVLSRDGETLGQSEPARVYVLRPSINFRNN